MNVCRWCIGGLATLNSILLSVMPRLNKTFNHFIICKTGKLAKCHMDNRKTGQMSHRWQANWSDITWMTGKLVKCHMDDRRTSHMSHGWEKKLVKYHMDERIKLVKCYMDDKRIGQMLYGWEKNWSNITWMTGELITCHMDDRTGHMSNGWRNWSHFTWMTELVTCHMDNRTDHMSHGWQNWSHVTWMA